MNKPPVTLENYQEVYAYYDRHQQTPLAARPLYALLSMLFRPQVSYEHDAREILEEAIANNIPLLIVSNHVSEKDPYITSAAAWRSPLRSVVGRNTRVLAKDPLFHSPLKRAGVEQMGSIPVFRRKNHEGQERLLSDAARHMLDVASARIIRGDNLGIYVEGTCNSTNPTQVQEVQSGVGHIIRKVNRQDAPFVLVPTAIYLGQNNDQHRSASVHIGEWTTGSLLPSSISDITGFIHDRLQTCVNGAVENYSAA